MKTRKVHCICYLQTTLTNNHNLHGLTIQIYYFTFLQVTHPTWSHQAKIKVLPELHSFLEDQRHIALFLNSGALPYDFPGGTFLVASSSTTDTSNTNMQMTQPISARIFSSSGLCSKLADIHFPLKMVIAVMMQERAILASLYSQVLPQNTKKDHQTFCFSVNGGRYRVQHLVLSLLRGYVHILQFTSPLTSSSVWQTPEFLWRGSLPSWYTYVLPRHSEDLQFLDHQECLTYCHQYVE